LHLQNAGTVHHDGIHAVAPRVHHVHQARNQMARFFFAGDADVHEGDPHAAAQNALDLQQLLAAAQECDQRKEFGNDESCFVLLRVAQPHHRDVVVNRFER